jgi:hypothetical protein
MKLSVFLMATLVAFASMAAAAPLCTALVGTGVGGAVTMADYVALGSGGCVIGDKLFSSFYYQPSHGGTGPAVAASAVFLTPVDAGTYSPGPGITFSSGSWFVPGGSTIEPSFFDASITFSVNVLRGGALIEDATLTMGSESRVTGAGQATIGEDVFAANGYTELGVMDVDVNGPLVDHIVFARTSGIQVAKNFFIGVDKNATGSARIYSFTENFSEVPEPLGAILIGSGLLALGAWRRRGSRG